MNEIKLWDFKGQAVRTTVVDGQPWFVAKDVCDALGLTNSRKTVLSLRPDEQGVTTGCTLGGTQRMSTVSESELYKLIFRSRKPEAEAFVDWPRK